eukprot:2701299-Lingulodinium_polyedra.AAC.1
MRQDPQLNPDMAAITPEREPAHGALERCNARPHRHGLREKQTKRNLKSFIYNTHAAQLRVIVYNHNV